MDDTNNTSVTILKIFIKDMVLNNSYQPILNIACTAKPEFVNDIILGETRSLAAKIIKMMNGDLLQYFYFYNINIIEFLVASRENQFGIEIKIPDMAKASYKKEIQHLISSLQQQVIYFFNKSSEGSENALH